MAAAASSIILRAESLANTLAPWLYICWITLCSQPNLAGFMAACILKVTWTTFLMQIAPVIIANDQHEALPKLPSRFRPKGPETASEGITAPAIHGNSTSDGQVAFWIQLANDGIAPQDCFSTWKTNQVQSLPRIDACILTHVPSVLESLIDCHQSMSCCVGSWPPGCQAWGSQSLNPPT